jgi:hypothetical protein
VTKWLDGRPLGASGASDADAAAGFREEGSSSIDLCCNDKEKGLTFEVSSPILSAPLVAMIYCGSVSVSAARPSSSSRELTASTADNDGSMGKIEIYRIKLNDPQLFSSIIRYERFQDTK